MMRLFEGNGYILSTEEREQVEEAEREARELEEELAQLRLTAEAAQKQADICQGGGARELQQQLDDLRATMNTARLAFQKQKERCEGLAEEVTSLRETLRVETRKRERAEERAGDKAEVARLEGLLDESLRNTRETSEQLMAAGVARAKALERVELEKRATREAVEAERRVRVREEKAQREAKEWEEKYRVLEAECAKSGTRTALEISQEEELRRLKRMEEVLEAEVATLTEDLSLADEQRDDAVRKLAEAQEEFNLAEDRHTQNVSRLTLELGEANERIRRSDLLAGEASQERVAEAEARLVECERLVEVAEGNLSQANSNRTVLEEELVRRGDEVQEQRDTAVACKEEMDKALGERQVMEERLLAAQNKAVLLERENNALLLKEAGLPTVESAVEIRRRQEELTRDLTASNQAEVVEARRQLDEIRRAMNNALAHLDAMGAIQLLRVVDLQYLPQRESLAERYVSDSRRDGRFDPTDYRVLPEADLAQLEQDIAACRQQVAERVAPVEPANMGSPLTFGENFTKVVYDRMATTYANGTNTMRLSFKNGRSERMLALKVGNLYPQTTSEYAAPEMVADIGRTSRYASYEYVSELDRDLIPAEGTLTLSLYDKETLVRAERAYPYTLVPPTGDFPYGTESVVLFPDGTRLYAAYVTPSLYQANLLVTPYAL
jgi:hypothetical protein